MFRYAVTQFMQCFSRLSLDPIDRTPFRHLMKFTQRSLIFYFLGLSTVSKLVWFFFRGLGLMVYILKLLPLHPANPQ